MTLRLLHRETVFGPKGEVHIYKDTDYNEYHSVLERIEFNVIDNRI